MDPNALIDEIVSRVAAKLAALNAGGLPAETVGRVEPERQPCILAVTEKSGDDVLRFLTDQRLLDYYRTASAPGGESYVGMDSVEVVVLYDFTLCNMVKIADGSCDTPYTRLVREAILSGKKVFIPEEEVMLLRYAQTCPMPYYNMLSRKLEFLKACGIVVCPERELAEKILGSEKGCCCGGAPAAEVPAVQAAAEPEPAAPAEPEAPPAPVAVTITKRVLHERDVLDAATQKATEIHIAEKCILTELAKEAAKRMRIAIVRQ